MLIGGRKKLFAKMLLSIALVSLDWGERSILLADNRHPVMNSETHKLVIAIEYLETAATLWLYELNHFSVIHLAAAAEEIAGKACRINGKRSYFDDLRNKAHNPLSTLNYKHTEQQLKDAMYSAKNAIKHLDSRNDASVNIDARKESADYIIAAYRNFEKLGLHEDLSAAVKRVVDANSIHIEIDT